MQINREMKRTRKKVFDNLDPKVRDKLKSYDTQTGVVLNAFERLLIGLTRHELDGRATFHETDTQFTLTDPPEPTIKAGKYYFKSTPSTGAHQYRYSSDLAQWVVANAKNHYTPPATLTFQLKGSRRATAIAKRLRGKSGRLTVHEVTFAMSAGEQDLQETYLLFAGFLSDDTHMDQEQIRDLLDLECVEAHRAEVNIDGFEEAISDLRKQIAGEVEDRNAAFYLQQESLIDAARLDLKATFDAKIREFRAKETTATKAARKASSTAEQLKLTREARTWRRKADEADDDYRRERDKLRDKSDAYLDNAAQALEAQQSTTELFSINWEVR